MEITKGKWKSKESNWQEGFVFVDDIYMGKLKSYSDAILAADAGNIYQQTNKLPSELAESNRILAEALTAFIDGKERDYNKLFNNAVKVLASHA